MPNTTQTNPLETVERLYAAFAHQDIEAAVACFADDASIEQSAELPWGGTYRGPAGVMEFFGCLSSHITTQVETERFIVAGDTVVEVGRSAGTANATGREFSVDLVHVFTVSGDRVTRMEAYADHAAMREALGTAG